MIKTSYFANYRNFPIGMKTVSISRFPPKWATVDNKAYELAPSKNLLLNYKDGNISDEEYETIYMEETLSKLNPEEIYKKYKNSIFLCYEQDEHFCHRQLVSKWLESYGFHSEELKKGSQIAILEDSDFDDFNYLEKILNKFMENYLEPIIICKLGSLSEKYAKLNEIDFTIDFNSGNLWSAADIGLTFWNGKSEAIKTLSDQAKEKSKKVYMIEFNSKRIYLNEV